MRYIAPRTVYLIDVLIPGEYVLSRDLINEINRSIVRNTALGEVRGLKNVDIRKENEWLYRYGFKIVGRPWNVETVGVSYGLMRKNASVDVMIRTLQVGAGAVIYEMEKELKRTVRMEEVVEYYVNKFRTGDANVRSVLWNGVKKSVFNIVEIGGEYYVQLRKSYRKIIEKSVNGRS